MTKLDLEPIKGTRVALRLLSEADLPTTRCWRNQDRVRSQFKTDSLITREMHQKWYQSYLNSPEDYLFIIEALAPAPRPVGQIGIYNIDWSRKMAEFGRLLIGEADCLRCGFAHEASRLLIDFWHRNYAIRRLYLQVKESNSGAIALYEKLGFACAGSANGLVKMELRLPHAVVLDSRTGVIRE